MELCLSLLLIWETTAVLGSWNNLQAHVFLDSSQLKHREWPKWVCRTRKLSVPASEELHRAGESLAMFPMAASRAFGGLKCSRGTAHAADH